MKTRTFNRWTLGLAALGMVSLATAARADGTNAPASTNAPAAQPYGKKVDKGFFRRLNEAYAEQFSTPAYAPPDTNAPPTPPRRIGDPPFDSPPFCTGDWQLGGGPNVIGDPGALRDAPYPLMQAIYDGPYGKWWYDSRIQFYGWVTISGNYSSSHNVGPSQAANFPEVYSERPNRIENEQDVLYIERMADMSQVDHIDWGFRLALLYGLDYRFMGSRGYLNDQNLFVKNKYSGFDTPMMYANLYIPQVAEGMEIIFGRIISMPDIEQQLAPNNMMASHSLVYSFDNYTMWGLWTTTKLNKNWCLQVGIADGVDIAPWETNDRGDQPTLSVNLQWIGSGGKDSFYIGMNSLNNGHMGFNNLQECIESYSHKFNDKCWTTFEGQYMFTKDCVTAPTKDIPIQDGFFPTKGGYVWTGGVVNYTCYRIAPGAFATLRNELWDDPYGYRSSYGSAYYEAAVGVNWWPSKLICLRPEIRYDHCFTQNGLASSTANFNTTGAVGTHAFGAYDNGTRVNQFVAAIDLTYHF